MTENPTDEEIVERVVGAYGDDPPTAALRSPRDIRIPVGLWTRWLTGQARIPVPSERADVARGLLTDLSPTSSGDELVIGRDRLRSLSEDLSRGGDAHLRLWLAVMMWGGGNGDPRAPWRTAEALGDGRLDQVLHDTAALARQGDDALERAICGVTLRRVGPSFATKWLWAAALAEPDEKLRPVVVDALVWGTLNTRLGWTGARAAVPRRGGVYRIAAAIRAINRWAPMLTERWQQSVAPDAVEHLLFARGPGSLHARLAPDPL